MQLSCTKINDFTPLFRSMQKHPALKQSQAMYRRLNWKLPKSVS